jgi:uncharacterized protein (DUF2147 family)
MKHLGIFLTFLMVVCSSIVKSQESDILGTWWNEDQTSKIRIFKATNSKFYGKIEYLKNEPDRLDAKNPSVEKQKEPLLGLVILKGFNYDSAKKQWTSGTIYDPDNGKTYDCFMWFESGTDLLYIKGYVLGMKFVGRETLWTRVKE